MGNRIGCLWSTNNYVPSQSSNWTVPPPTPLSNDFTGATPSSSAAVRTVPNASALLHHGSASSSSLLPAVTPNLIVTRTQLQDLFSEEQKKLILDIMNGEQRVPGNNRSESLAYMVCWAGSLKEGLFDELKISIGNIDFSEQEQVVSVIMTKNDILNPFDRIEGPYFLAKLQDTLKLEAFKFHLSLAMQPTTFKGKEVFENFAEMTPAQQKMTIAAFTQAMEKEIDKPIIERIASIIYSASRTGNDETKELVLDLIDKLSIAQNEVVCFALICLITPVVLGIDDVDFVDRLIAKLDPEGTSTVEKRALPNTENKSPPIFNLIKINDPTEVAKLSFTQKKNLIAQVGRGQACVPGETISERLRFMLSCKEYLREKRLINDVEKMVIALHFFR